MPEEKEERLKEKLRGYYGTAMANGLPLAVLDLARIEEMDEEELEKEAEKLHLGQ